MTCIIGLVDNGTVYLAADSALCDGWEVRTMAGAKIFPVGDVLFGMSGSLHMAQLIQYCVKPASRAEDVDDMGYLIGVVLADVHRCLKEHGCTKVEDNVEEWDGSFLIAYRKRLFMAGSDGSLRETTDGLDAIGSGREYALGAMLALSDKPPCERLVRSLECTAAMCANVRAPWVIESLPAEVAP